MNTKEYKGIQEIRCLSTFLPDSFRPLPVAKEIVTTIFQRFRTNAQCLPLSFRIASGSFRWPLKTSMCKTKAGMSIHLTSGYLPVASGAAAILIVFWQIYSSWFQDSCRPYWGVISNAPHRKLVWQTTRYVMKVKIAQNSD